MLNLSDIKRLHKSILQLANTDDCCAYCGTLASDNEHIVPYSYLSATIGKKRIKPIRKYSKYIVRACRSCNLTASSKIFSNFWEKKQYIASQLEKTNKKLLKTQDWTDQELNELKGRLQMHVYQAEFNKKLLRFRIINLKEPIIFGKQNNGEY